MFDPRTASGLKRLGGSMPNSFQSARSPPLWLRQKQGGCCCRLSSPCYPCGLTAGPNSLRTQAADSGRGGDAGRIHQCCSAIKRRPSLAVRRRRSDGRLCAREHHLQPAGAVHLRADASQVRALLRAYGPLRPLESGRAETRRILIPDSPRPRRFTPAVTDSWPGRAAKRPGTAQGRRRRLRDADDGSGTPTPAPQ
jgi:hypothetical protein